VSSFTSIPVLDYTQSLYPTTKPKFLAQLRDALINVGFLYLKNPPVSNAAQNALTQKGFELFRQPLEKKLEIEMVNSPHFLGYSRLGAEITALKSDHREQFDVGLSLNPNDLPRYSCLSLCLHCISLLPSYQHLVPVSRCTEISADLTRYLYSSRFPLLSKQTNLQGL
jgi:isopenicillin N synthase-like dioxygenase